MNRISEPVRPSQAASLLPHLHNLAPNFTPPATALPPKNLQLDIYMGGRCPICSASLDKIESLRQALPNVTIRVFDIDAPDTVRPANVIALPSIFLNGHLVATGNPQEEELVKFIRSLR